MNGRIPPQAVEVEESVLGSILLMPESADTVFERLKSDDFYKPAHKHIYQSIISLYTNGNPFDAMSVVEHLKDNSLLDVVGGENFVFDLTKSASYELEYHCQIIIEKALRRNLIIVSNEIQKQSYDTSTDTLQVVDYAQESIFKINEFEQNTLSELHESLQSVAKRVAKIQESGEPIGLKTGLDIDNVLKGFQDAKLYILGARPSMGKTALVMTMMREFARCGVKSGMLSLETSDESLAIRLIAQQAKIPAEKITSGRMNDDEYERFLNACQKLSGYGIFIDDKAALSAQQVRSKCRILARKGVQIIFIDFLQLIKGEGRSKHEEIGNITKVLKQVSKELGIPIVALSQLSRKVEDRQDKRPNLADLRESGSIEEDADCVLFLYRPEYYGITKYPDGESTSGVAEIIVAKNKDGRTGSKKHIFQEEIMRFVNMEQQAPF